MNFVEGALAQQGACEESAFLKQGFENDVVPILVPFPAISGASVCCEGLLE